MNLCPDPAPCDAPASSITIPNLQQLTLRFITGSNPEMFFRSLILPRIERLSMKDYDMEMPGCTSLYFANMVQRSGMSRIQNLYLGKGTEPYQLVDLLKYMSSLSCLEVLGDVVFDSQTLEDMSTGQLGPNMRNLYLPLVEDSSILEMVWTRFQNALSRDKKIEVLVTPITSVMIRKPFIGDGDFDEINRINRWGHKLRDLGIRCLYNQ